MTPIQQLMEEHRNIISALEAFEKFAIEIDKNKACDRQYLGKFVLFIREYADAYHHAKEEDVLFKAMEDYGFSPNSGPVAVMLHEHDQGRQFVKFLREASEAPNELTQDEIRAVVNAIRGYCGLLRNHIMKEDNILYPMAQNNIPKSAWLAIDERFAEVERRKEAEGILAKMQQLGVELIAG